MRYFKNNIGNQSVLVYATLMGSIVGWDLRSSNVAWKLEHNLRHGNSMTAINLDQIMNVK